MKNLNTFISELRAFTEYVCSFYDKNHPEVIYPIATKEEIEAAIVEYIASCGQRGVALEFDSIDREAVRAIIGR